MSARCSLLTEPWWARAMQLGCAVRGAALRHDLRPAGRPRARRSPRRSSGDLVEPGGQPLGEPARVGEHDRGAVLLDQVDDPLLDVRPDRASRLGCVACGVGPSRSSVTAGPSSVMSSTGTTTSRSHCLRRRRRHDLDRVRRRRGSGRPPRSAARSRTARSAAPGGSSSSSSRSSDRARWAPRLVPATAWTSSTITVSTPRSASRACEVSIRNSDSGVVISTSGGGVASRRRSAGGRVAGADADGDVGDVGAEPGGGLLHARPAGPAGCARRRRPAPSAGET